MEDEDRTDSAGDCGSGSRDEFGVPQGGAALVRVQPVVRAVGSKSDEFPSDGTSSTFHPESGGGDPSSGGPSSTRGTDTVAENGCREACWA